MKKTKCLTLLVASLLLAGCKKAGVSSESFNSESSTEPTSSESSTEPTSSESSSESEPVEEKQSEVKPELAAEVISSILTVLEDEGNWPSTPDEFSITFSSSQSIKTSKNGLDEEEGFLYSTKIMYSKANQILYEEYSFIEDGEIESEECWTVMEEGALCFYHQDTDKRGVDYDFDTDSSQSFDEYFSFMFSNIFREAISELSSETNFAFGKIPEFEEGAELEKYETYYGSNNAKSVQIEEFLKTSQKNVPGEQFGLDEGVMFNLVKEKDQEVNIEDYFVKSIIIIDGNSIVSTDDAIESTQKSEFVYNYVESCEDMPEFNKTLWELPE